MNVLSIIAAGAVIALFAFFVSVLVSLMWIAGDGDG
jgi:hypothetical protein